MTDFWLLFFRFFHFIGLSALIGGLMVQVKRDEKRVTPAVFHGALTQLITGIVLFIITLADANHLKVMVKLVVLLLIVVILLIKRKQVLSSGVFFTILLLSVLNVGLAVFW